MYAFLFSHLLPNSKVLENSVINIANLSGGRNSHVAWMKTISQTKRYRITWLFASGMLVELSITIDCSLYLTPTWAPLPPNLSETGT